MAGARVKPKCDTVGGKRLPDLKSLQAQKSKRRKLQEKKRSACNQEVLHLETAYSQTAPALYFSRWACEELQAPADLTPRIQTQALKEALPTQEPWGDIQCLCGWDIARAGP